MPLGGHAFCKRPAEVSGQVFRDTEVCTQMQSTNNTISREPVADPAVDSGVELTIIDEENAGTEHALLHHLFEDYAQGRLSAPMLPDLAVKVREAMGNPNVNIGMLNDIVITDPSIAARLIQMANSAAYRGIEEISTCRDAIARIGLNATRDLVTALVLKELFKSPCAELNQRMHDLWSHGTQIAAISSMLGKLTPGINPDRALLAGLVHDIGAVMVTSRIAEVSDEIPPPALIDELIARLRGQFGSMALRAWEFPEDMIVTALEAEEWDRDPTEAPDVCDIVLVAHLLSLVGTPELEKYPPLSSLPAFSKLGLGELTPQMSLEPIEEAKEGIAELERSLAG